MNRSEKYSTMLIDVIKTTTLGNNMMCKMKYAYSIKSKNLDNVLYTGFKKHEQEHNIIYNDKLKRTTLFSVEKLKYFIMVMQQNITEQKNVPSITMLIKGLYLKRVFFTTNKNCYTRLIVHRGCSCLHPWGLRHPVHFETIWLSLILCIISFLKKFDRQQ